MKQHVNILLMEIETFFSYGTYWDGVTRLLKLQVLNCPLTHWGRNKMDAISQTTFYFKCIFLNEHVWIPNKISLKIVPKGPINNNAALVQVMAWRRLGDKPLSEPMMLRLPTHICVTRPQWVKERFDSTRTPLISFQVLCSHIWQASPRLKYECFIQNVTGVLTNGFPQIYDIYQLFAAFLKPNIPMRKCPVLIRACRGLDKSTCWSINKISAHRLGNFANALELQQSCTKPSLCLDASVIQNILHTFYISSQYQSKSWWRHQIETFSALLVLCEGNPPPPIIGGFSGRGIHRSPVDSPHKGERRGASMFSLICAWTNS